MTGAAVILFVLASAWTADRSAASVVLNDGAYIMLIRHGDAPGRSEPPGFDLNDCSTQRGLSEKGRIQARNLGGMFRARGINVVRVLASRFCRAHETAQLLNLRAVEDAPAFDDLASNERQAPVLLDGERKLMTSWHGPGVMLIVSHGSNIQELTGIDREQASMVLVSLKAGRLQARPFSLAPTNAMLSCSGCF